MRAAVGWTLISGLEAEDTAVAPAPYDNAQEANRPAGAAVNHCRAISGTFSANLRSHRCIPTDSIVLKRLTAFLLILWLPLQGMAMVAMPFCKHAAPLDWSDGAGILAMHSHGDVASDRVRHHDGYDTHYDGAPDHSASACDQCELCHLACAGYVPAESKASPPLADRAFSSSEHDRFRSFHGELFDRPPAYARA